MNEFLTPNLARFESYEQARREFAWSVPAIFNIAKTVCSHRDAATRLALFEVMESGSNAYTFGALHFLSDKLANVLASRGITQGDRVAIILPQSAALLISHLATLKLGAVVVPLTTLFGPAALEYRLRDSGARAVVTGSSGRSVVEGLAPGLPDLNTFLIVNGEGDENAAHDRDHDFWPLVTGASSDFSSIDTASSSPAFILYTSESSGDPKGAVHAHSFLLGHLPAFEMFNNFDLGDDTVFWTPADWAWIGALFDTVYPALFYGRPIVAHRHKKFGGAAAFALLEQYEITNTFLPPTALRIMKRDEPDPRARYDLRLRNIFSGGEALTPEILEWASGPLGASINEGYGQTEANLLVSNCAKWFPPRPGSVGKAVPGHDVRVVDDDGRILAAGETGNLALKKPDPVMFIGYLNKPEKTRKAFIDDWLITGDIGFQDEEGYLWFRGRNDDSI